MGSAVLIGDDGRPIECHEPRPGCYFAATVWTAAEARHYVETGEYPARLLARIRAALPDPPHVVGG